MAWNRGCLLVGHRQKGSPRVVKRLTGPDPNFYLQSSLSFYLKTSTVSRYLFSLAPAAEKPRGHLSAPRVGKVILSLLGLGIGVWVWFTHVSLEKPPLHRPPIPYKRELPKKKKNSELDVSFPGQSCMQNSNTYLLEINPYIELKMILDCVSAVR